MASSSGLTTNAFTETVNSLGGPLCSGHATRAIYQQALSFAGPADVKPYTAANGKWLERMNAPAREAKGIVPYPEQEKEVRAGDSLAEWSAFEKGEAVLGGASPG